MPRMTAEEIAALDLTDSQWDAIWFVAKQVQFQNQKWGEQNHDDIVWAAINAEEVGEAQEAMSIQPGVVIPVSASTGFYSHAIDMGWRAKVWLEGFFHGQAGAISRVNKQPFHEPDVDKEIASVASTAIDWLACRWRREVQS